MQGERQLLTVLWLLLFWLTRSEQGFCSGSAGGQQWCCACVGLLWVNPHKQLSTTQCLLTPSLPSGAGEEERKSENKNTCELR